MKYCIHLFLLIFVWHYAQAQNSVSTYKTLKADSSRANYFSKTDFNKVVFPFAKSNCNPQSLIKQTKSLNATSEYQYLYQDSSEPNLSLNTLSKEEMCILLKSNYATGYYNDISKVEKPLSSWKQSDFSKYHVNKIEVYQSVNNKKCVGEGGVPFIVRFEKKNGSLIRTIIRNENANFECFAK